MQQGALKIKKKMASVIAQGKGRGGRVRRGKPLQSCILQKYAVGGRAAGRAGSSSERGKGQRRNVGARGPAMQMTAPSIQRRRAEKGSSGASLNLEGGAPVAEDFSGVAHLSAADRETGPQ